MLKLFTESVTEKEMRYPIWVYRFCVCREPIQTDRPTDVSHLSPTYRTDIEEKLVHRLPVVKEQSKIKKRKTAN